MAGYSNTPLLKKLGIKPYTKIIIQNEPMYYFELISPISEGVSLLMKSTNEKVDFIHLFVCERSVFEKEFLILKKKMKKEGMMWVSWPKKASKVQTDLSDASIRDFGLANGLVDVKVCAVDDIWTGLKFVYRVKDR